MNRPSFTRFILPSLAALGLAIAVWLVATGAPDRSLTTPAITPPTVPPEQRGGSVAGAGLVEPSSEAIEIGTQRGGLVTAVLVKPGDRVSAGQLLARIDDRDARAALAVAAASATLADRDVATAEVNLQAAAAQLALFTGIEDPRAVAEQQVIDRRAERDRSATALTVAKARAAQAHAQEDSARTDLALRDIRAPRAGEILQVRTRPGQFATAGPAPGGSGEPLMTLGETRPLHVRIDIDENEIARADLGADAVISPRGAARRRVTARWVRTEPLVIPKRSLTNQGNERVDVRVLQVIYALPGDAGDFFVGQQVDAFVPARR
jgi:multidrug efflux pump subunit AcrA (membrane-fusion protein)